MLRLRPYKKCDAKYIVTWFKDELSFRKWCSNRYETYPITPEDMNKMYEDMADSDSFYPMTVFDEDGVAGHLTMHFIDEEKQILRFGFIVINDEKRGKGYGKEMLLLALQFAFELLKVKKVNLVVFDSNPSAYQCYMSVGFKERQLAKERYFSILGETWKCIELEMDENDYKKY